MPKRRLEAEALRDAMLAVGGQLDLTPPEGSAVGTYGEGNVSSAHKPGSGGRSTSDCTHRSVYLPIVRDGVARGADALRLRRPEPDHRRAADDHGAGPGAVPDEQPVRDPAGRGSPPNSFSPTATRRLPRASRRPTCASSPAAVGAMKLASCARSSSSADGQNADSQTRGLGGPVPGAVRQCRSSVSSQLSREFSTTHPST